MTATDLQPVLDRLALVEDPIYRAVAAQAEIARLTTVRDAAMKEAWDGRPAGSNLGSLARTVGVTRAVAAIAVSRGGQT